MSTTGIILLDKAAGMSSHRAVGKVRLCFDRVKGGHAGTLDPMATGLLPVLLGGATKFSQYLLEKDKKYIAQVKLGTVTDTGDITGAVVETAPAAVTYQELAGLLPRFTGQITQTPPLYSAIQVDGRRLYDIAREGGTVEIPSREVEIYDLKLAAFDETDQTFSLEVHCSKGTYIRSLAVDIGRALGCGATLTALRRTAAGPFAISDAVTLETLENAESPATYLLPVDRAFSELPAIELTDPFFLKLLKSGLAVEQRKLGIELPEGSLARCYTEKEFLGLVEGRRVDEKPCLQFARQLI